MKKVCKWVLGVLLTPVLLLFVVAVSLYLPPVQDLAVRLVTQYASEHTGYDIRAERVRLVFPLDLGINGVSVLKHGNSLTHPTDTIADINSLTVNIRLLPLFKRQVEIDQLDLRKTKIDTDGFIVGTQVKGFVGRLTLESHGIDLGKDTLRINSLALDNAQIGVFMSDTTSQDTAKTENFWKINVEEMTVARTRVDIHTIGDSLHIGAYLGSTTVKQCHFDLHESLYKVGNFELKQSELSYDNNFAEHEKGFDTNHIGLSDLSIAFDSLLYSDAGVSLALKDCAAKEKCGLCLTHLSGNISLDSTKVVLPDLKLNTTESTLYADVKMPFSVLSDKTKENARIIVDASFGKQDIMRFIGGLYPSLPKYWPNYPLTLKGTAVGNVSKMNITNVLMAMPTAFRVSANGSVGNFTDTKRLTANIDLKAQTYNLDFLKSLCGIDAVNIPRGMTMRGSLQANGERYAAKMSATAGKGTMNVSADANLSTMAYKAQIDATALPLYQILPNSGLKTFSGRADIVGQGTDLYSSNTKITLNTDIKEFVFDQYNISDISLAAEIRNKKGAFSLQGHNDLIDGAIDLTAELNRNNVKALLDCDVAKVDLYRLHVTDNPLTVAVRANVMAASNMKNSHRLKGTIKDILIQDSANTYRPEDLMLDIMTRADTSFASVQSGDFDLRLAAKCGYEKLLDNFSGISEELKKQLNERYIDQLRLRRYLPELSMHLETGRNNFFQRALVRTGNAFRRTHIDIDTSPEEGINGKIDIDSLVVSGIQLDTIRLALNSDSVRTDFDGQIRNGKNNPQYVFNALFRGAFYERGLYFGTRILDADDQVGISVGLNAAMESDGLRLRLGGRDTPILGYKPFNINEDNYVFFGDDRHVSANLKLQADDGMGVIIYTNDSTEALQDLTVGLMNFELSKVLSIIPYVPDVSGVMNGDFHLIQTEEELSVSSFVTVDDLVYEGSRMGNVASEFVYIPKGDGSHFVDGTLACNDLQVGNLRGTYNPKGNGSIDATLTLERTPLSLANGFIPDKLFNMRGYAIGEMLVQGSLDAPVVEGEVRFDSAYIASPAYGVELRFAETPVAVEKSHLVFDNFSMYAANDSPLTITGYYDFADMDNMFVDLRVRAKDYLLIDSKENPRSETYGKAYVNFFAMMKGSLESMRIRGKLDVLGSTDMTYILRDSPLTTDNQMDELVKFVNFQDSTANLTVTRPPLTGMDVDLTVSIDEGAHIVCALNADHSNYVDLIGGGDLRMQYNVSDNLRLTGKYTLSNGEMKYSLPIIPLKTFTIQDGSYIEFTGDPMNPKLNITATETTKCTVSSDGETSRSVEFECGVVITKTLQDMGLAFTIDAPEDMTIHNELQTMSTENRGKIAVTMLTTGMYLADGNTNSFSMNSALSAFLNSQISTISGNALRTLDLSFGMDNTTSSTGETHTDYSFKFAKRFWNNRLSIVVGGKLSTGAEVENQNNTFFDNVTFEYRLSQNSNKYLKLFYERDSYDWLEGNVGKYGAGFMWRRKLQHFKDIFRFKTAQPQPQPTQNDSTTVKEKAPTE